MRINYFEEFPDPRSLKKAKYAQNNSIIFLAANSIKEYQSYKKDLLKINPKVTPGYWPIFKSSYWLSGLTDTNEIESLINELRDNKEPILLDLELPLLRGYIKSFKNMKNIKNSKKLILKLIRQKSTYTFEYMDSIIFNNLFYFLGVKYKKNNRRIVGFYDFPVLSPFQFARNWLLKREYNKNKFIVGLGTIGSGITGNEKDIRAKVLKKRIELLKKIGVEEIFIFRLGGLKKEYLEIIK